MLLLSQVHTQSIYSSQIRPLSGDSLDIDFYSKYVGVDNDYELIFASGENITWDLSDLHDEYGVASHRTFFFENIASPPSYIDTANFRVCKKSRSSGYTVLQDFWYLTDSVWFQTGFNISPNFSPSTFSKSCEFEKMELGYNFTIPDKRFVFPLSNNSSWVVTAVSESKYYDDDLLLDSWVKNASGTNSIIGFGTLKTPELTVDECYLLFEDKIEVIEGDTFIFKRYVWLKPFVSWPILEYREWIDKTPDPSTGKRFRSTNIETQVNPTPAILGLKNIDGNTVSLYPNPSNGIINISNSESLKVQVFDINGALIMQANTENAQLDLSALKNGVYILKMDSPKGESVFEKLIIQH